MNVPCPRGALTYFPKLFSRRSLLISLGLALGWFLRETVVSASPEVANSPGPQTPLFFHLLDDPAFSAPPFSQRSSVDGMCCVHMRNIRGILQTCCASVAHAVFDTRVPPMPRSTEGEIAAWDVPLAEK